MGLGISRAGTAHGSSPFIRKHCFSNSADWLKTKKKRARFDIESDVDVLARISQTDCGGGLGLRNGSPNIAWPNASPSSKERLDKGIALHHKQYKTENATLIAKFPECAAACTLSMTFFLHHPNMLPHSWANFLQ